MRLRNIRRWRRKEQREKMEESTIEEKEREEETERQRDKETERERGRERRNKEISWSSLLLRRRIRREKRRRSLCRGCLVGSSEAPTGCPTAFVWYFINTSANYFPFFTSQFRSGIGECTLQARSVESPRASRSAFRAAGRPRYAPYKSANVRKCVCTRTRMHALA